MSVCVIGVPFSQYCLSQAKRSASESGVARRLETFCAISVSCNRLRQKPEASDVNNRMLFLMNRSTSRSPLQIVPHWTRSCHSGKPGSCDKELRVALANAMGMNISRYGSDGVKNSERGSISKKK
jgi:hypothetical protein